MADPVYPITEQISQAIISTLETLTSPSAYQTVLNCVERMKWPPQNPADGKAILIPPEDSLLTDDQTPIGDTSWDRTYQISVYHGTGPDEAYDTWLNVARADIAKLLLSQIKTGQYFGGLVQNCWEIGAAPLMEPNEMPGIAIWFRFQYRTDQYDPYTLG